MDTNTPNRRQMRTRNPVRPPATGTDGGSLAYLLAVALALATLVVACDLVGAALR